MNAKDWASVLIGLVGSLGWLLSWIDHRRFRKRLREKEIEQRGIKGYKFRKMYRTMAIEHGWPLNGEDED